MFARQFSLAAVLAASVTLAACNDSTTGPESSTVRFVNAIPTGSSLSFSANGEGAGSALAFQGYSACTPIASGNTDFSYAVTGSPTLFSTGNVSLQSGRRYTVVAAGLIGAPTALVLNDSFATPAANRSWLRVVNALNGVAGADSVAVYVTPVGGTPGTVAVANLHRNDAVAFVDVPAGVPQEVQLTTVGNPSNVIATSGSVTFTDQGYQTLIFTRNTAGTGITSVLIPGCP